MQNASDEKKLFPFPKVMRQASEHLRPDIHTHVSQLLLDDYPNSSKQPTTQFIDELLSRTYPGTNDATTIALNSMGDDASGISTGGHQRKNSGPLSMFYKQPYSISPNNIFQSIVITQLNAEIRSKDDIDIQIIKPNELHLIATGRSMPSSNENRIRSKSSGMLVLRFYLFGKN